MTRPPRGRTEGRRCFLNLPPQGLETRREARVAAVSRGCIAEIHEETDCAVVARGLFRRDEVGDLRPYRRLSSCQLAQILCARRCPLGLAPLPLGFGSRCLRAPALIAKLLCGTQQCGDGSRFARLDRGISTTDQALQLRCDCGFLSDESLQIVILRGRRLSGNPRPDRLAGQRLYAQRRTGRGSDLEQVCVDSQEIHQALQRSVQLSETRRNRRLRLLVLELFGLCAAEPADIQGPEIALSELRANRNQRRKCVFLLRPLALLFIRLEREDRISFVDARRGGVTDAVELRVSRSSSQLGSRSLKTRVPQFAK